MKLQKIAQICKKHTTLTVMEAGGVQWINIGAAAYAVYGMPKLKTKDEVMAVLDVPENKSDGYNVKFANPADPKHFLDVEEGEKMLREVNYTFMQRGRHLRPLFDDDGAVWWLSECYLAPLDADGITYHLRTAPTGHHIAVKKGFSIMAMIGVHLVTSEVEESLHELITGSAVGWRKGYRVPREIVERNRGLQMLLDVGLTKKEPEEEEYEQETLA